MSLSTSVRGLVPLSHLSASEETTKNSLELFKRGMGIRVLVRKVDEERRGLILSLVGESHVSLLVCPETSPSSFAGEFGPDSATGTAAYLQDRLKPRVRIISFSVTSSC